MKEIDCFSLQLKRAQSMAFCVSHHKTNNIMSPRLSINCRMVTLASSATSIPFTGLISKNPPAYTDGFYEEMILTDKPLSFGHSVVDSHSSCRPVKAKTRRSGFYEEVKLTDKPGSVVDSHSSRPAIAHWLKQPTRVQYGPYLMNPYLALLRVEFTVPRTVTSRAVRSYRTLSPLPDPTCVGHRRFALCCTGRGFPPQALPGTLPYGARTFLPSARLPERTTTKRRLSGQLRRAV